MAKILWLGDAGSHTGFARVTHAIGERLVAKGHDVHVLAVNYDGGDPWPTTLKLYVPTTKVPTDIYGQSRFIELLAKIEPDAVVILNDPNIILDLLLRSKYDPQQILLRFRPLLAYVPIDAHNHPPPWAQALHRTTKVIAMSEHGQRELTATVGGETKVPPIVYHGVDTDVFRPATNSHPITLSNGNIVRSKREAKEAFGWSKDDFVVLRVDKNSGRKDYPATWKVLVPFMHKHPNVRVHLHCQGSGLEHGLDIESMLSRDEETRKRFSMPKDLDSFVGWPVEDLVALYNAADVFLTTSRGEGFGLTIAEALACGTPVIGQNVSAIPEVVGPGGILIDGAREATVPSGKDQWLADIPAFTEALERLYQSSGARKKLGEAGRKHVVDHFSWDTAADQIEGHLVQLIADGEKAAAELAAKQAAEDQPISEGGTTDG